MVVFLKQNTKNEYVAVKQIIDKKLKDSEMQAFEKEAILLSSLPSHPNIVRFLGICVNPMAIITEFCDEGNLLDYIQKKRCQSRKRSFIYVGFLSWNCTFT